MRAVGSNIYMIFNCSISVFVFVFVLVLCNFQFSGDERVQKCVRLDQIPAARGLGGHWRPEKYFVSKTLKSIPMF